MVGGEPTPWFAGAVGAVSLLGVLPRIAATRRRASCSTFPSSKCAHLEHSMYPVTYASMAGAPFHQLRGVPVPGIEPTADGHVGFFVITGQQWLDFCALHRSAGLGRGRVVVHRHGAPASCGRAVGERSGHGPLQRTTAEIVEIASLMRIPVAPIGNGRTIPHIDHFVDQEWLVPNPGGFVQPRRPYRFQRRTGDAGCGGPASRRHRDRRGRGPMRGLPAGAELPHPSCRWRA